MSILLDRGTLLPFALAAVAACGAATAQPPGSPRPLLLDVPSGIILREHVPFTPAPNTGAWPSTQIEPAGEPPAPLNRVLSLYRDLDAAGRPKSIYLRGPNTFPEVDASSNPHLACPDDYPYCYPNALSHALQVLADDGIGVDLVLTEYEVYNADRTAGNASFAEPLLHEVTRIVREFDSPLANQARIGSYDIYPATAAPWFEYNESIHATQQEPFAEAYQRLAEYTGADGVLRPGFNLAAPSLYPRESYAQHVGPTHESGVFYGPLSKFTHVRETIDTAAGPGGELLFEGHLLTPYVADYWVDVDLPNVEPPTYERMMADSRALVQHLRLLGADGFVSYGGMYLRGVCRGPGPGPEICSAPAVQSPDGGYDVTLADLAFTTDIASAWTELDGFYGALDGPIDRAFRHDKAAGVYWSASSSGENSALIVSNLSGAPLPFDQLPDATVRSLLLERYDYIGDEVFDPGEHRLLVSLLPTLEGDFNRDDEINWLDIDALAAAAVAEMSGGAFNPLYDLDGDGDVDRSEGTQGGDDGVSDLDYLIRTILGTEYGDANLDGRIDLLDLDLLGQGYDGSADSWLFGDFDGDGGAGLIDLDLLGQYYGFGASAPAQVVPEPASGALVGSAAAALLSTRRRRSTPHGPPRAPLLASAFAVGTMLTATSQAMLVVTDPLDRVTVTVTPSLSPVVGSGYITYTFSVAPVSATHEVTSLDAAFTADSMRQVSPPGPPTVFEDMNHTFDYMGENANGLGDSQFHFMSSDVLAVGASESAASLTGAMAGFAPIHTTSADATFAHVVLPAGDWGAFDLKFVLREIGAPGVGETATFTGIAFGGVAAIPEPRLALTWSLLGAVAAARRRRFHADERGKHAAA